MFLSLQLVASLRSYANHIHLFAAMLSAACEEKKATWIYDNQSTCV